MDGLVLNMDLISCGKGMKGNPILQGQRNQFYYSVGAQALLHFREEVADA